MRRMAFVPAPRRNRSYRPLKSITTIRNVESATGYDFVYSLSPAFKMPLRLKHSEPTGKLLSLAGAVIQRFLHKLVWGA